MDPIKFVLLLLTASTFQWASTDGKQVTLKCTDPEDRCVPVSKCTKFPKPEGGNNYAYRKLLRNHICTPEVFIQAPHVCCPKPQIKCEWNGELGVCALSPNCPNLQSMEEENEPRESLCYVRNGKNYYCCTYELCVIQRGMCDQDHPVILAGPPSVFVNCTTKGKDGSLVPKKLCDYNYTPAADNQVCCAKQEPTRLIAHHKAEKLARMSCGIVSGDVPKVYNGNHTVDGEFPWMANLMYSTSYTCSGTLIHPSYVLTAGHCVKPGLTRVRLGLRDLKKARQTPEMQEISIAQPITSNMYDVALLRLTKAADVKGDMVRPICLPLYAYLRMRVPNKLVIAGWGKINEWHVSNQLLKGETPVVSPEECSNKFELCIGGKTAQNNQCGGDSGGPYQAMDVFNEQMRYVQFGIISNGQAACRSAKQLNNGLLVGYVIDWILDNMSL